MRELEPEAIEKALQHERDLEPSRFVIQRTVQVKSVEGEQ